MSEEQTAISRLGEAVVEEFGGVWVNASDVREAVREISQLRRERDLAIAHDTQPYPTAWAYEQLAKAHNAAKDRIEELEKRGCCGVVSEEDPRLNIDPTDQHVRGLKAEEEKK